MAANNQNSNNTKKRGPGRPPGSKNKAKSSSSGSKSSQKQAVSAEEARLEKIREMQAQYDHERRNIDVIWSITLFALGLFLFIATLIPPLHAYLRKVFFF
jgi:hypothetical protein